MPDQIEYMCHKGREESAPFAKPLECDDDVARSEANLGNLAKAKVKSDQRLNFCALCVAMVMGASAASASPKRVLTIQGLGAVHIGMTLKAAQAAAGGEFDKTDGSSESKACWIYGRADGADQNLSYMIENGRLTRIEVRKTNGRGTPVITPAGIGVGSTTAEMKRAYGALVITSSNLGEETYEVKDSKNRGAFVFAVRDGQVINFRAGVYPSVKYAEGCQ